MPKTTSLPGAETLRAMAEADANGLFAPDAACEDEPYLNRELSWLAFNRRVLLEAAEPSLPAWERLKFRSIYGTNLDEFYMVRAGGLLDRAACAPNRGDRLTDMTPKQQLTAIAEETERQIPLLEAQYRAVTAALRIPSTALI